jgi:hypothetical protein
MQGACCTEVELSPLIAASNASRTHRTRPPNSSSGLPPSSPRRQLPILPPSSNPRPGQTAGTFPTPCRCAPPQRNRSSRPHKAPPSAPGATRPAAPTLPSSPTAVPCSNLGVCSKHERQFQVSPMTLIRQPSWFAAVGPRKYGKFIENDGGGAELRDPVRIEDKGRKAEGERWAWWWEKACPAALDRPTHNTGGGGRFCFQIQVLGVLVEVGAGEFSFHPCARMKSLALREKNAQVGGVPLGPEVLYQCSCTITYRLLSCISRVKLMGI